MKHPFTIGGTYRNRRGEYIILALQDDKMRVRYQDGAEDIVNIATQARIWENIQADEAGPPARLPSRHTSYEEGGDSWPIAELVQTALATFSPPYPADIIDQVCLAIERNPTWLQRYHHLVEHFSSQAKDGKLTVNSSIGWYTKDLTGMITVKAGNPAKSTLIDSYSTLRHGDPRPPRR